MQAELQISNSFPNWARQRPDSELQVVTKDALAGKHGEFDIVLANPPFGKKSCVTIVNEAGEQSKESLIIIRDKCPLKRSRRVVRSKSTLRASRVANWPITSNTTIREANSKTGEQFSGGVGNAHQLNFLQHIFTIRECLPKILSRNGGSAVLGSARREARTIPAAGLAAAEQQSDAQYAAPAFGQGAFGLGLRCPSCRDRCGYRLRLPPRPKPHSPLPFRKLFSVSTLNQHGRAAVVLPDNVLFEGGAGETIRRALLKQADVHTLLRLPTGIFYAQGVKANVLFFDRKPAQEKPWTEKLWIYDLRTNKHFTLKESTLKRSDLDEFVNCYFGRTKSTPHPGPLPGRGGEGGASRFNRKESERFKCFSYDELLKRDKVNLDIFWLKDEALEESANLPAPEIIAQEISDDLEAALEQFATIADDLKR